MKLNKLLIVIGVVLALTALALGAVSALPIFTGNAPADFAEADFVFTDSVPSVGNISGDISGWDVAAIYFDYDSSADVMYIGIDCGGADYPDVICGDADGDGDPGGTSQALADNEGTDWPDLAEKESFALAIDTNNDVPSGNFEVVVGVSEERDINSFGTYKYSGEPSEPQVSFGDLLPYYTTTWYHPDGPNADAPDIEFSIARFSELPGFDLTSGEAFEFQVLLYVGSRDDDGIGEDYVFGVVNIDVDGDGQPGTGTPGYWKNHPEAWPVDEITIGGLIYSKDQAIPLMKEDKHDKTTTMFRSLVAAKLNVLIGNDSSCIAETIAAADEWMVTYGPVGSDVKANSAAWKEGEPLYLMLDDYNNGLLCAPSRDDLE
jgi:hypothetical protein